MTELLLVVMAAVWAVNFVVVKAALEHLEPLAFNSLRFAVAASAMAAIAWPRGGPPIASRHLTRLALLGLLGNFVYQVCFIEGIARTRAGNAALILATMPVLTAALSQLVRAERHGWRTALALGLSTIGIGLIVAGGAAEVSLRGTLLGDLLVLAGACCWAGFTVGMRPLVQQYGTVRATAWTMVVGAVPLLGVGVPALGRTAWEAVPPVAYAEIAYSALGALVLAYLIWYRAVKRIGATRTAVFSYLTPVITLAVAWPVLGEAPTAAQGLGAACIFVGISLSLRS